MTPPQTMIDAALSAARSGPCAKSKRGVAIYHPPGNANERPLLFASNWNAPPYPLTCAGNDVCRENCSAICVHAEAAAITAALEECGRGRTLVRCELVHVKVSADGRLVGGKGPSCWQCSKLVLQVGLAGVWLYEAPEISVALANVPEAGEDCPPAKWVFYSALDFHMTTLEACELPFHVDGGDLPEAIRQLGGIDLAKRLEKLR